MENEILKLIKSVPQKYENFGMITYQMKFDIYKYFHSKNLSCVEIGCYNGYTTNIFSKIFKSVTALDNNEKHLEVARKINEHNENVNFVTVDLYDKNDWDTKVQSVYNGIIDVALVDAAHSYECAKSDVVNAINLGCKYIILDDVGVYDGIKKCVSEIKEEYKSKIKNIIPIGVDWYHYKLPILSFAVQPYRIMEKNVGSPKMIPQWLLRDDSDLKMNDGETMRPLFNPIDLKLEVLLNNVEFRSGHIENKLSDDQLLKLNFNGPNITNSKNQNLFNFIPFPAHRFDDKNWMSMMYDDERFQYSEDQVNFEGLIIELE
jgi:hypothetical protein